MSIRGVFLILLGLLSAMLSFGQTKNISGVITNNNHTFINHASVHLLGHLNTVYSNTNGQFSLPVLEPGNYTIVFGAASFSTVERKVKIGDSDVVINVQLLPADTESFNEQDYLGNVTVTAEKRAENVQEIPASVSAFTAKQISDYRLWNSNQLTALVPSLYSDNSGDARNVTSIRGITTTSYDPAVATYVDGVNQFTLDTYIGTLTDVERIEVLRGSQGTLYGRNAMGGVINIITKQPTNKPEAFAEVSEGNHGLQRYNAGFRTPLIKNKLFLGASFLYTGRNGYYTNDFNNTSYDKQHLFYGNYYLKYLPGRHWTITANVKHQENRNNGTFPLVFGVDEAFANAYHVAQNATAKMIDNSFNGSLVINHAGNAVNLAAISSYQKNYRFYNAPLDGDFSPYDVISVINNYGKNYNDPQVFTQEIKVNSNNEKKRLQYTTGAYFFYQNNPIKQGTYFGELANAVDNAGDSLFTIINTSKSIGTGIAFYGQFQYAITPKLMFVGGLRYDYEHRKLSVESEYHKEDFSFVSLPDTAAAAHFHAVSPKLSLKYLFSAASNVYATYSRGFRAGGLSSLSADPSQPPLYAYAPENSNNFEVGSKNVLLHKKLVINLAAFTTYVDNAQVPTLLLPAAVTIIRNTGKLRTKGIEAELEARLAKGLEIMCNAGVVDTKYKSLKLSQNGNEVNLEGKKQIFTPSATSMFVAQYGFFVSQQTKLVIRSEWQYKGRTYFDFANTIQQSDYSLFNARAGVETKHFGIYVWARNMGDKKYIAYAYDFGAVHLGEPRTYSITMNANF